ncbi:MAG: hypothetical protein Q4G16_01070 [Cruoricaptor ignavus]|nr:hypothetical protein [Cruoricaptor ignavus]
MKVKTYFQNNTFYWLLILFIGTLIAWNTFFLFSRFEFIIFLPIIIQTILLYLIVTKNKYAKLGIKIWTIFFLIIAYGLQFFGQTLKFFATNFTEFDGLNYFRVLLFLVIGIFLLIFTNKTVEVK